MTVAKFRALFSLALRSFLASTQLHVHRLAGAGMPAVKREGGTSSRTERGHSAAADAGTALDDRGCPWGKCPETCDSREGTLTD
ncbi:hypothetical protein B0T20DRAFT_403899 [Sordaria brevicollis]|uniref:Secreted protein n=1 Tax=Sordaria brevicollis TaxID=83679 RepID=A0AAE0PLT4_SORBR|nr:hypothetical protein B0T20DRAFT_403899 [Sordaria brevicollis]